MNKPTTLDILVRAKELLNEPNVYIKHMLYNGCGGFCAIGALYQVNAERNGQELSMQLPYTPELGVAQTLLTKHSPDRSVVKTNNNRDLNAVNEMFCGAIKEEVSNTHGTSEAA